MKNLRSLAAALVVLAAVCSGWAQTSLVGDWTGKLSLVSLSQEAEQAREVLESAIAKMKLELTLRADKTFKLTVTEPGEEKPEIVEGTWSLKDQKLTFRETKKDGVASSDSEPKVFTVAKDGKSFALTFEDDSAGGGAATKGAVTFTRKIKK